MSRDDSKSDSLLRLVKASEDKDSRAKLRIFFGMCAGVGKTYAMLKAAHQKKQEGLDIVVGLVETHGRKETEELLNGLEIIPRKESAYKGVQLSEFDLDAALLRKPSILVLDELPHTNVEGSRHKKRYQDLLELLDNGIDVYTTVNVQHIESLKEIIEKVTGISIQETVPDSILDRADIIELIDLSSEELLKRLREGKIYLNDKLEDAQKNFFRQAPLNALREIALRLIAERVDKDIQSFTEIGELAGPLNVNDRLMVALSHSPYSEKLIRAARRIAFKLEAPWIAVNIDTATELTKEDEERLNKNIDLAKKLGAQVISVPNDDIAKALAEVARLNNVTHLIIGRTNKSFIKDFINGGDLIERLQKELSEIDIHIVPSSGLSRRVKSPITRYFSILVLISLIGLFSSFIFHSNKFMLIYTVILTIGLALIFLKKIRTQRLSLNQRSKQLEALNQILDFTIQSEKDFSSIRKILDYVKQNFKGTLVFIKISEQEDLSSDSLFTCIDPDKLWAADEKEKSVAKWVLERKSIAGWSSETLPSSQGLYFPLIYHGNCIGLSCFIPNDRSLNLTNEEKNFLAIINKLITLKACTLDQLQ